MKDLLIALGIQKFVPPPNVGIRTHIAADSNPDNANDGSGNPVDYIKGQIHRANILDVLEDGPCTAAFIADEIGMKRHAISHHLIKVLEAGTIARTPEHERKSTERALYWINGA
jgi:predicted transcriptional regulator